MNEKKVWNKNNILIFLITSDKKQNYYKVNSFKNSIWNMIDNDVRFIIALMMKREKEKPFMRTFLYLNEK